MIEIISCKECNNIITTSENICFYTNRYENCNLTYKIKGKEKIIFIGDDDDINLIRNAPNEFEYLVTKSEIKCKNCGTVLGKVTEKDDLVVLGIINLSNVTTIKMDNTRKFDDLPIHSQKENECLSTMKELRNLCDVVYAYSKDITLGDIGNIKIQIDELSKRLDDSKMNNLLIDKEYEKENSK